MKDLIEELGIEENSGSDSDSVDNELESTYNIIQSRFDDTGVITGFTNKGEYETDWNTYYIGVPLGEGDAGVAERILNRKRLYLEERYSDYTHILGELKLKSFVDE